MADIGFVVAENLNTYQARLKQVDLLARSTGQSPVGHPRMEALGGPCGSRHATGRFRRISPVPLRPCEGPLTEPTPAVQHLPAERVFVPHCVVDGATRRAGAAVAIKRSMSRLR